MQGGLSGVVQGGRSSVLRIVVYLFVCLLVF